MDLGFGPDEGPGGLVVVGDEGVDVGDEFLNAGEGCALQRFPGQDREPDFDLAEPGGVGRRVVEMHGLVALEPDVALGLVGGEIVEDDMDFAFRIGGDNRVHEVEEFDAPASLVVTGEDFAAGHVERGEQRCGPVTFVVVRLAGHGAPVRQLQIALGAFERLNGRLFVDGEHNGVVGRRHVEPDDVRGLGGEFGIVALTPGSAAGKVDFLRA